MGQSNLSAPQGNLVRVALLKQAAALREQATSLETLAELAKSTESDSEELLTETEVKRRYGMGRAALDARGARKAKVGRAWKWRVSDIEAVIQAAPATPRPPRKSTPTAVATDPLDALIADGSLVARGSRR